MARTDSTRAMDTGNVTHEEIERRKHDLADLMGIVAAEVAKDGGTASLGRVAYAEGTVEVVLSGACGSCTLTGATLEDGIKRVLTQRLDWVRRVDGIVEDDPDATGTGGWTPRATSR